MTDKLSTVARRILGVVFIFIVIGAITLSIAIYNKAFTAVERVDLITDDIAYSLPKNADVKVNGVTVGEVRSIEPAQGRAVRVELALDPEEIERLPGNVTARMLPKTLFGERFVELQLPDVPVGSLADTDEIVQDAEGNATELGRVLDGLLPVLEAVPPDELAITLGALRQTLEGRGDKLGASLVEIGKVFEGVAEEMPALESGLQDLATFSQTYAEAGPEIISALDALRTTSNTVVERRSDIAEQISVLTRASNDLSGWLETNRDDVISLADDSREGLDSFAKYSPALGCTLESLKRVFDRSFDIVGANSDRPGVRVTTEIVNPRGRYLPNQDETRALDERGPICYGVPAPGTNYFQYPGGSIADGSYQPPSRNPGPATMQSLPDPRLKDPAIPPVRARGSVPPAPGRAVPEQSNAPLPKSVTAPRDFDAVAYVDSDMETTTVQAIYAAAGGTELEAVPQWVARIGAPALRGSEVTFQ